MGGTFDPIHLGHLIMASYAADSLGLDEVLFVPAQTPPHKLGEDITPVCHRVAMVNAAIGPDPRFSFSDMDLRNDAPSYTSDLLARFHEARPEADLYFIIGADSLRDFPTWHEPGRILDFARLAVARRPGVVIDDATLDGMPRLRDRATIFASPLIGISSTSIRNRVVARKPITWLLPAPVEQYILTNGLYRGLALTDKTPGDQES
jgi:nicotinate-nucleotide adenylyltransferase